MTASLVLFGAVLIAAAVEVIETAVVVLAVSRTHGPKVALSGAGVGALAIALLVAIGGVPAVKFIPLRALQIAFGLVMIWVAQKWLRKSILRASGRKALRNESANYAKAVTELSAKERREGFTLALRQTILEGLEVAIVVVAMGSAGHHLMLATTAALVAIALVVTLSLLVAPWLMRISENRMKLSAGVAMAAMGLFWLGEGIGLHWPGSDMMILALVALVATATYLAIRLLRVSTIQQEA